MSALSMAIKRMWGKDIDRFKNQEQSTEAPEDDNSGEENTENLWQEMRKKRFKESTPAQTRDPVSATVEDFFAQKFLIHRVLANQKKPVTDAAKRELVPTVWGGLATWSSLQGISM